MLTVVLVLQGFSENERICLCLLDYVIGMLWRSSNWIARFLNYSSDGRSMLINIQMRRTLLNVFSNPKAILNATRFDSTVPPSPRDLQSATPRKQLNVEQSTTKRVEWRKCFRERIQSSENWAKKCEKSSAKFLKHFLMLPRVYVLFLDLNWDSSSWWMLCKARRWCKVRCWARKLKLVFRFFSRSRCCLRKSASLDCQMAFSASLIWIKIPADDAR